jgi:hypothetical protein
VTRRATRRANGARTARDTARDRGIFDGLHHRRDVLVGVRRFFLEPVVVPGEHVAARANVGRRWIDRRDDTQAQLGAGGRPDRRGASIDAAERAPAGHSASDCEL